MNRIGKFDLLGRLGGGGMADVYLAVEHGERGARAPTFLAVKTPRPDVADDPEFVSMFLDEARLAARLDHPNVVRTVEVGEADGRLYIAMEYLDGQPLHRVIAKLPELSLDVHLRILTDVLRGIHHAHELDDPSGTPLNIIHRDLTPQNVFVTYDGITKILDFGIARAEGRSSKSSVGLMKGKVSYMSPEQAITSKLDRRTDLFAVGVMLFEACTRRRMWEGVAELDILETLHRRRHVRSPQTLVPALHDDLDAICQRALAVMDHRYQTAAEFLRDIESYVDEHATRPTSAEIAAVLSPAFSKKRDKMKAAIDAQLVSMSARKRPEPVAKAVLKSLRESLPDIDVSDAMSTAETKVGRASDANLDAEALEAADGLETKKMAARAGDAASGDVTKVANLRDSSDSFPDYDANDVALAPESTTGAHNVLAGPAAATAAAPAPAPASPELPSPVDAPSNESASAPAERWSVPRRVGAWAVGLVVVVGLIMLALERLLRGRH